MNTTFEYEITTRRALEDKAGRRDRVFIFDTPDPTWTFPGGTRGENAEVDKECARWNREKAAIMREHTVTALTQEFGEEAPTKLKFSAKAGCTMCPCSPGFITEDRTGYDTFITATAVTSE